MSAETREGQLDLIEKEWYKEAQDYKNAGSTLRNCLDSEERRVAMLRRENAIERSDILLDTWLYVRDVGAISMSQDVLLECGEFGV